MKNIFYFVDNISIPFVINDVKKIAERHNKVFLFSVNALKDLQELPPNVQVFDSYINWSLFKPRRTMLKHFRFIFTIYLNECRSLKKVLPLKTTVKVLVSNIFKAEQFLKVVKANKLLHECTKESTFYSFWFYDCIYLAWLKRLEIANKVVVRTHGGDLYEDRGSLGKVLLRHFQFQELDCVLSVSKKGELYLKNKYPKYHEKIKTVYLGSANDQNDLNPFTENTVHFTIVSCANVRNVKRIHAIAESLLYCNFKVKWFHIGAEDLANVADPTIATYKKNIAKVRGKEGLDFYNVGRLSSKEIFDFYREEPVNLFISLSESEGVPVSMMEAISFGIPILSTDVGGCNEIVTNKTGLLIPLETAPSDVAQKISEFKTSAKNTEHFRKGVKQFWWTNFEIDRNYETVFKLLDTQKK